MKKILIADDDKSFVNYFLRSIYASFENNEITIDLSMNLANCYSKILDNDYDKIFLDFDFKFGDIRQVLDLLKGKTIQPKIYILSGYDEIFLEEKIRPFRSMIAGVIEKTAMAEDLDNFIKNSILS